MSQRVIDRIKKFQNNVNDNNDEKARKKVNRKSKRFYVTCDYIKVNDGEDKHDSTELPSEESNTDKRSGLIINVQSEPVNLFVDGNSEVAARERKKRNRKSKLFYGGSHLNRKTH